MFADRPDIPSSPNSIKEILAAMTAVKVNPVTENQINVALALSNNDRDAALIMCAWNFLTDTMKVDDTTLDSGSY